MTSTTKRILNCVPSKNQERDWLIRHSEKTGSPMSAPPPEKDLREEFPDWQVGNQFETGSCVGWAVVDFALRYHLVKAKRLRPDVPLSPRFTWMAAKEIDADRRPTSFIEKDGTAVRSALDITRKFGAVPEEVLPFDSARLFPGEAEEFYALAANLRISSYFNLRRTKDPAKEWRRWIANHGPIVTRLDADAAFMNAHVTNGNLDEYEATDAIGGHAVALVGYRADGRFIVRNSFGAEWGDNGYAYASESYAEAAFSEAYGIRV